MKVRIIRKDSLTFYRFTRSDGRAFLVGRTFGECLQFAVNNNDFSTSFCVQANITLAEFVGILENIKFDRTLQDQILKLDNKRGQK